MNVVISVDYFGDEGEADLVEWLVSDGDQVITGQPLAGLETAKTVNEFKSPGTGIISLKIPEGETVSADDIIATIL